MGRGEKAKVLCAQNLCFDGFFLNVALESRRRKKELTIEFQINARWKSNTTEGHIGMQIESNTNKLHRINENLLT